jgi:hypothetical protein
MEGAILSGKQAAEAIIDDVAAGKAGTAAPAKQLAAA